MSDSVRDFVLRKLEDWKNKLIDMSFRNPFINFKPLRKTTLQIIDELPNEIFRHLYLNEKQMSFLPLKGELNIAEPIALDFSEYDREALAKNYTDLFLQTNLDEERLRSQLTAIFRKNLEWIEERGVCALYLTLGMLRYFEDDSSEVQLQAPLILLPVELTRPKLDRYYLKSNGEDPIVNPSLIRKMEREFQISLPSLPEDLDNFHPETFFGKIQKEISHVKRWEITNQIYLSFFHFQKILMYKDIEENSEKYLDHPIILESCEKKNVDPLPDSVFSSSPDSILEPNSTFHVLDADSSQQRALLAARSGRSLVIEGPPGTGKSQTIVNLIAEALSNNKTVLFVSEKKAALDVVFRRLQQLGLHHSCLELHSNKTTKSQVFDQINNSLDAPSISDHTNSGDLDRLATLRNDLNLYVRQLHEPFGEIKLSPFQMLSEIAKASKCQWIDAAIPKIENWNHAKFTDACNLIKEHAAFSALVGDPASNTWVNCQLRSLNPLEKQKIEQTLDETLEIFNKLYISITRLSTVAGITAAQKFSDIDVMCSVAAALAESPTTNEEELLNPRWNSLPEDATELLRIGKTYRSLTKKLNNKFSVDFLAEDLRLITELAKRCDSYSQNAFCILRPQYWRDKKYINSRVNKGVITNKNQLSSVTKELANCLKARAHLQKWSAIGQDFFGSRWAAENSNWDALEGYANWLVTIRGYFVQKYVNEKGLALAASGNLKGVDVASSVNELRQLLDMFNQTLAQLVKQLKYAGKDLAISPKTELGTIFRKLEDFSDGRNSLQSWVSYQASLYQLKNSEASEFLERSLQKKVPPSLFEISFKKLFFHYLYCAVSKNREKLQDFDGKKLDLKIGEFRSLDKLGIELAQQRLLFLLRAQVNALYTNDSLEEQRRLFEYYRNLKRRKESLRKILNKVPKALQIVAPCFLMSPLSVAEFLDPKKYCFDLVIFDEASQVTPEDAIGTIIRGKQIIVVGDSKQLPPTNFFVSQAQDDDNEVEEIQDLESILDQFRKIYGKVPLNWHYRSKDESLIAFSNKCFYKNLFTFPHAKESKDLGLRFIKTQGIYEGSGTNRIEAESVVDGVVDHVHNHSNRSLGVVTFGIRQMELIRDLVEQKRREDASIEFFFQNHAEEPFFVKNLETIQGDERDVIFLSLGYGPDAQGVMRYNFGPINGENGWRRLNVMFTRSKYCMKVFSSIHGEDMDVTRTRSQGASLLRDFLIFAEKRVLPHMRIDTAAATESPFEEAVKTALIERGLDVVSQVSSCQYRIDLGIKDTEHPGSFLLGIECDGYSYHSAATARDRDRLRLEALEDRGWKILRIWSIDWYHDSEAQIQRVLQTIEKIRTTKQVDPPQQTKSIQREMLSIPEQIFEPEESNNFEKNIKVEQFRKIEISKVGSVENFYVNREKIKEVLYRVIQYEGPVHIDEIKRRVAAHWGIDRVGNKVSEVIESGIKAMCKADYVSRQEDFLHVKGLPIRVRTYPRNWKTEYISPAEYEAAVQTILESYGPLPADQLIKYVCRLLGFERSGEKLNECVSNAIKMLLESKKVRLASKGIQLV